MPDLDRTSPVQTGALVRLKCDDGKPLALLLGTGPGGDALMVDGYSGKNGNMNIADELPGVDVHGKSVCNWIISGLIYGVVGGVLCLACGIGLLILIPLAIVCIVFPIIGGGMTALFSSMFLIHVGMGIAMLNGALDGKDPPPKLFAWVFIVIGSVCVVAGWTLAGFIIAAGRRLKRRASHMFCLAVAGLECFLMPFGTVLGVFTLIILQKEPVKQLFANNKIRAD